MNLGFGLNIDETAQETGYDKYEVSLFESLGAVAADNWNFNPVMSLWNYNDLSEARNKSRFSKENMVDRLELNKEYAKIGLYFEEDEYQSVVDIMVREKNEERARQRYYDERTKRFLESFIWWILCRCCKICYRISNQYGRPNKCSCFFYTCFWTD
jgi:hypothetical protein